MSSKLRSFLWILVAVSIMNVASPAYVFANSESEKRGVELDQEMNRFKKLIKDLKETRELYLKKREGKASPEELKKLDARIKTIKKSLYITASVLLAALMVTGGIVVKSLVRKKQQRTILKEIEGSYTALICYLFGMISNDIENKNLVKAQGGISNMIQRQKEINDLQAKYLQQASSEERLKEDKYFKKQGNTLKGLIESLEDQMKKAEGTKK